MIFYFGWVVLQTKNYQEYLIIEIFLFCTTCGSTSGWCFNAAGRLGRSFNTADRLGTVHKVRTRTKVFRDPPPPSTYEIVQNSLIPAPLDVHRTNFFGVCSLKLFVYHWSSFTIKLFYCNLYLIQHLYQNSLTKF